MKTKTIRKRLSFLMIHLILGLTLFSAFAEAVVYQPTLNIPPTAGDRQQLALVLEKQYQQSKDQQSIAQLAILYAVIAGLDDFTEPVVEKAIKLLAAATQVNPGNYELMAAYGSVMTMRASFAKGSTAKALRATKKGFRLMDRALKKSPNNIGALLQRGNNSLKVPPFLRRLRYAEQDFKKVLKLMKTDEKASMKAMVLFKLGEVSVRQKNRSAAKAYWQQAAAMNVPGWSEKANKNLTR